MKGKISVIVTLAAIYLYYIRDNFNQDNVWNKNVLVTGASKGIGKALALQYAKFGANVLITARNETALKEVFDECKRLGRKEATFDYVVADMLDYTQAKSLIMKKTDTIFSSLDHVILNHALLPGNIKASRWSSSQEQLDFLKNTMEINFISYVHIAGEVIPHLMKSRGRLGIISSMAGKVPLYASAPYSASKFALDGFFSTLRLEMSYLEPPVSVTLCNLGHIDTGDGRAAKRAQELGLDIKKLKSNLPSPANVNDTALAIIKAILRGDRELYYPRYMYGVYTWFVPLIRHVVPSLVEINPDLFK